MNQVFYITENDIFLVRSFASDQGIGASLLIAGNLSTFMFV